MRQLRHYFEGHFSALQPCHVRRVLCSESPCLVDNMRIGARNPMVCPIRISCVSWLGLDSRLQACGDVDKVENALYDPAREAEWPLTWA